MTWKIALSTLLLIPSLSISVTKRDGLAVESEECADLFYGEVLYTDLNRSGELVHKSDVSKFYEWSEQSQFDYILVEKNASLLKAGQADSLRVSLNLSDRSGKSTKLQFFPLQDWVRNSGFLKTDKVNLKNFMRSSSESVQFIELSYWVGDKIGCTQRIPVR